MIEFIKKLVEQFPLWLKALTVALGLALLGYIACVSAIIECRDYWWITFILLGLNFIIWTISGIVLSVKNRKIKIHIKKKAQGKKVDAYVFDVQDAEERDAMFKDVDCLAEHTYWVLGSSLHSLTTEKGETSIEQLIKKDISIKFIMMDPKISSSHLFCKNENMCHIYKYIKNNINDTIVKEDLISLLKTQMNNYSATSQKLVILNNHLNSYFSAINYKQRIEASYAALESIRQKLDPNQLKIEARKTQSLMSVSLTIVDADFDNGCMIAEFHLPFTQSRVMLKLTKKEDGQVFDSLVIFYKEVLKNSEQIPLKLDDIESCA